MKWGLSGQPIPPTLPYAEAVNRAALESQASPCGLYAIGWRETIGTQRSGWLQATYGKTAATVISPDGGFGIFQITTTPIPDDWADPCANALWAADHFYDPYLLDWINRGFEGVQLLKLAADDFNAGDRRVRLWHAAGNADGATTGGNYGSDVVTIYGNLIAGRDPDTGRPS